MLDRKEIERAVMHQIAIDPLTKKSPLEIDSIVSEALTALSANIFDFSKYSSLVVRKDGKSRYVKRYEDPYAPESILCQCIKQILDRTHRVRYPNRNKTIRYLFDILPAVIQMTDFTIVKIDFKDFFNSVSTVYVFEKCLSEQLLNRAEKDLIKKFVVETQYTYAGLNTSNAIAEIIAKCFDKAIHIEFQSRGIVYYDRYVDDCLLILNQHIDQTEIDNIIYRIVENVFRDPAIKTKKKCKTRLNKAKSKYLSRRTITNAAGAITVDFLGYLFSFEASGNKVDLKYGITQEKRNKYNKRIDKIIESYITPTSVDFQNLELLRHRISAFTSRTVYMSRHYSSTIWKTKGFISNYNQLRYMIDAKLLHHDTEVYLKNMVDEAFIRAGIDKPYFLKSQPSEKNGYNLFGNLQTNKSIILVENVGYDYRALSNLCQKVGIANEIDGKRRSYRDLVRQYLIKVKVGY
ncbi:MAG: hypothetical protein IJN79_03285 [Clostridia bacterium]|nr:hypothetical protein [Clostridia bacterium]